MSTEQEPIEDSEFTRIPDEVAVLPISEAVIFPYMMVPLVLSDPNLIRLADDVLAESKVLGCPGWC